MARKATIKLRQDTYENFEADVSGDGILKGEAVYLTDKKALVVGDGVNGVAGHPTLIPVGNYHNTEVDGWTVTKDNNDIERKFWKDDFSVDSSADYTTTSDSTVEYTAGVLKWRKPTINIARISNPNFKITTGKITLQLNAGSDTILEAYSKNYSIIFYDGSGTVVGVLAVSFSPNDGIYRRVGLWSSVQHQYMNTDASHIVSSTAFHGDKVRDITLEVDLTPSGQIIATRIDRSTGASASATFTNPWVGRITSFRLGGTPSYYGGINYHSIDIAPSESYSDDFATDTVSGANGRYQAVTGTVAYDDVNKRMNVITATGANGKASGRLKSYTFTEGSQIYDVTLPTGADGDFITLVTHSANGLMTDGIGVGLQSDGAGNWNLATLSGTTVTEGADSGLDDADVARIEIEKDITGAYWYYIYNAAGTKPTTATGKLFTTKSEGYTGWYANGAGAETQTYAIDNISIRAESIVGRTNVQVEEPFWFRDEFGENSIGRVEYAPSDVSVAAGKMTTTTTSSVSWVFPTPLKNPTISQKCKAVAKTSDRYERCIWINRGSSKKLLSGNYATDGVNRYIVQINGTAQRVSVMKFNSSDTNLTDTNISPSAGYASTIPYDTEFTLDIAVSGNTITVSIDGTDYTFTDSGTIYESGLIAFDAYRGNWEINDLQISGTRVYNKPIHRGAMLETYHDGTQEVVGTTFVDDCQWDRSAEYTLQNGTATYDAVNGYYTINVASAMYGVQELNGVRVTEGIIGVEINRDDLIYGGMLVSWDGTLVLDDSSNKIPNNALAVFITSTGVNVLLFTNGALTSSSAAFTPSGWHKLLITIVGTTAKIYVDGVLFKTITNAIISAYDHVGVIGYKSSAGAATKWRNLQIIAAESSSTNGIAVCIPPIGGGARYGVQEGASIEFTNKALRGDYDFTTCVKTTVPGAIAHNEMYFGNTTDASSITEDTTTTKDLLIESASYRDFEQPFVLNYDDREDTITVGVRKHTDNDPTTYIDFMAVVPTKEVI